MSNYPRRVSERWISTWFYEQDAAEGGLYEQMSGAAVTTETSRDIYRRCIALFFLSARSMNPQARLRLFLNRPWRPEASAVAFRVQEVLDALGVERVILSYTFRPPASWMPAWRNQFFVFDVLSHLNTVAGPRDAVLVLDSDIIWNAASDTSLLWSHIDRYGSVGYPLGYPVDRRVNGLSRIEMVRISERLGFGSSERPPVYFGGEFIALSGEKCSSVVGGARIAWPRILEMHAADNSLVMEEAHLLSMLYAGLNLEPAGAEGLVKRLWTQPFKFRNVVERDLELVLWHVPAEKRFGLRRLYGYVDRHNYWTSIPGTLFSSTAAAFLGLPRNTLTKLLRDVAFAVKQKGAERSRALPNRISRATSAFRPRSGR